MDATIDKYRLIRPIMQVKNIWKLQQSKVNVFYWTIPQFVNLKKNVEHRKSCEYLRWNFTITKKRGNYVVTISNDRYKGDIYCSVRYSNSIWSDASLACRVSEGPHRVVLPNSIINTPKNEFLKVNILQLSFSFNPSGTTKLTFQPRSSNDTCNYDYLKMVTKRLHTQIPDDGSSYFALHNKEKKFYVHKAILVARSSYFRQYIREKCKDGETGEMELYVNSEVMYNLVSFLYSGQALFKCADDVQAFIGLLGKFGIGSNRR